MGCAESLLTQATFSWLNSSEATRRNRHDQHAQSCAAERFPRENPAELQPAPAERQTPASADNRRETMNAVTVVLSSFSVMLLIAIVMQIVHWMKMQRDELTYFRQQNGRLIEENRHYKMLFFRMLDNRLERLEREPRAK